MGGFHSNAYNQQILIFQHRSTKSLDIKINYQSTFSPIYIVLCDFLNTHTHNTILCQQQKCERVVAAAIVDSNNWLSLFSTSLKPFVVLYYIRFQKWITVILSARKFSILANSSRNEIRFSAVNYKQSVSIVVHLQFICKNGEKKITNKWMNKQTEFNSLRQ